MIQQRSVIVLILTKGNAQVTPESYFNKYS
jgi:hypothetical protein